ncbi:hypothetical protein HDU96_007553 [Phlyctochytrium bullatum]|nr:hypothetical protein HDU96_007553 [Phlyctochytrium bullatum]
MHDVIKPKRKSKLVLPSKEERSHCIFIEEVHVDSKDGTAKDGGSWWFLRSAVMSKESSVYSLWPVKSGQDPPFMTTIGANANEARDSISELEESVRSKLSISDSSTANADGVVSSQDASKPIATDRTSHAREDLKNYYLARITQWPFKFKASDRIQQTILANMDPFEFHRLAPLVSKSWRNYVRNRPRPVALTLRLVVSPSRVNAVAETTNGVPDEAHAAKSVMTLTRPAPTLSFTPLPERYAKLLGAFAGEHTVATCDFDSFPATVDGVKAFFIHVTALLRNWADTPSALDKHINQIAVVPLELQLSGAQLVEPLDLEKLSKIIAILDPRVVKISRPPAIIFHLLSPNIETLHLTVFPRDEPIDFTPLELCPGNGTIGQRAPPHLRFGSKLRKLVLDGQILPELKKSTGSPGVVEDPERSEDAVEEEEGDEEDFEDYYGQDDLKCLGALKGITDLRIGTFFPVSDYAELIPTLCTLTNLERLSIRGLFYGDQPGPLLATLFTSLPKLKSFSTLGEPRIKFWEDLGAAVSVATVQNLKTLALSFEQPLFSDFRNSFNGVIKHLPSVQRLYLSMGPAGCLELTAKNIIDHVHETQIAQASGEIARSDLKILSVSGVPMNMQSVLYMGKFNMVSAPEGGISVQIKVTREFF